MAVVSRYIAGLCVLIAVSAFSAEKQENSTLSFSGKGNGPIQVTDDSGTTDAVVSRPIVVVQPNIPKLQHVVTAKADPETSTAKASRDDSIDQMLKSRPKRDPRRMNTTITPAPPRARKH